MVNEKEKESMQVEINAESKQLPNGKWVAEVSFHDADGTPRLFMSPEVATEEEADALAYGGAHDVVRQLKGEVTFESWNGHQVGRS